MATPPRRPTRPPDAVRGGLWLALAALLAWLGSLAAARGDGARDVQLAAGLAAQGMFLCTALGGAALAGTGVLPEGLRLGRSRLRARETVLLVIGFVSLSLVLGLAIQWLQLREASALGQIDRMVRSARAAPPSFALAVLALGVAPAFCEELLFRGLIQQGTRRVLGPRAAIVISALAFGLVHMDPVQGTGAVALGLYLGVATELAASVRTAILCHLTNNLLGVLAPGLSDIHPPDVASALAWVGVLLALAASALAVARRRQTRLPAGSD